MKENAGDEITEILNAARGGNLSGLDKKIDALKKEMIGHAANLDFEKAAKARDQAHELENLKLKL